MCLMAEKEPMFLPNVPGEEPIHIMDLDLGNNSRILDLTIDPHHEAANEAIIFTSLSITEPSGTIFNAAGNNAPPKIARDDSL